MTEAGSTPEGIDPLELGSLIAWQQYMDGYFSFMETSRITGNYLVSQKIEWRSQADIVFERKVFWAWEQRKQALEGTK